MSKSNFEKKRCAEELIEHREAYRGLSQLADFLPDPTFAIDTSGRVILWNRTMEELSKVPAEEIMGKADYEYSLVFYGTRRPILIDRVIHPGEFPEDEYACVKHEGRSIIAEILDSKTGRYLWIKAGPIYDGNGRLIGAIETVRDITEKNEFEIRLRKERDFASTLVKASPAFFVAISPEGSTMMMNDAMLGALGYTAGEVEGAPYLETFVPAEEHRSLSRGFSDIMNGNDAYVGENSVIARDGSRLLVEWHGRPVFDGKGNPECLFGIGIDITERKKIEENLKASEAKYRDIFENVSDFLYVHDLEGRFIETNLMFKDEMGYSRDYLKSTRIQDIMPERFKSLFKSYLDRILRDGKDKGSMVIVTKQGDHRTVEYRNSLIRDEQGNPVSIRGSARDVTEHIQADKALRKSEQQYRLLSENIRDVIWLVDMNLKYEYVSPSAVRLFGFTSEEIIAQSADKILSPESYNNIVKILAEELEQETRGEKHASDWSRTIDVEMQRKDGSFFWAEITASFLRDSDGKPTHIVGVTRDITKRKAAEDALRTSEERFRSLFEDSADAYLLIEENRFADCNRAALEMLKMASKEEILNMHPSDISPEHQPDGRRSDEKAEEMMATAIEKGSHRFEWMNRKSDGTDFPTEIVLTPITRAGKRLIYTTLRDITEQKKAEEERRLYETRIMRSQKLEAIGTLAGGIAHDFNNILSAIIGYTELARDGVPEKSSTHRSLQEVLKAGDRAKDLVSQILTFSRQVQSEKRVVNVHLIVKEAMKLLRSSIPSSINIVHGIDPKSPPVLADPTQIHQVIMNLCTNAYQAMINNCGTMTVSLNSFEVDDSFAADHLQLVPGPFVKLTVSDTGCGMDHTIMNRIFEPFFSTKEKTRGTGLGLATVHGIVAGLSGTITVTSTIGRGSTFDVYMPAYVGEDKEEQRERESVPAGNGEKILMVDDETAILEFGKNMIEQMGYSVTTVSSSTEALSLFAENPHGFDLVITDQTMPSMTGVQLSSEMMVLRKDIPIILITGYSETLSPDDAKNLGIRIYLEKPFTRMEIAAAIHEILS